MECIPLVVKFLMEREENCQVGRAWGGWSGKVGNKKTEAGFEPGLINIV
jgi:hypothetical protein